MRIAHVIASMSFITMLAISAPTAREQATFAGTWVGGPHPLRLVIEQDATRMIITDERGRVLTYQLDGSESRNVTTTVRGEKWAHLSQARWVSSALVIMTTTTREAGQRWEWMTIYRRDREGNLHVTTLDAVLDPGPFNAMALSAAEYRKEG
jgi:hypothetical protein